MRYNLTTANGVDYYIIDTLTGETVFSDYLEVCVQVLEDLNVSIS